MTEANGCPECLRETVASDPLRAWSTSVRARSANVGSGTAGASGAPGGPAWRFMARSPGSRRGHSGSRCGHSGDERMEPRLDGAARLGADQPIDELAVLEEQQRRDAPETEARGRLGVGIDVELADDEPAGVGARDVDARSEEHTSELQSQSNLVCRLLLEKKKTSGLASARSYTRPTSCRR